MDFEEFDIASMAESGVIVAVGQTRDYMPVIAASENGETWERADLTDLHLGEAKLDLVIAGPNGFVVTGVPLLQYGTLALPEPFLLYSGNGHDWHVVPDPEPCTYPMHSGAWTVWGFTLLGGRCRGEGDFDPTPIRVLTSADGRNWTSTTDHPEFAAPKRWPSALRTDGARLVAFPGVHALGIDTWLWVSDDGGSTWRTLTDAVSDTVRLTDVTYGHGMFLAGAYRNTDGGNEDGSCVSPDGESWNCRYPGPPLPHLTATSTGYLSIDDQPVDLQGTIVEVIQVTSTDGITWDGTVVEAPQTHHIQGTAATSRGVFAWGYRRNDADTEIVGFFLVVHRAPLP